jgi:F-type H+-transporting ATPase subunit epsilon
MAEALSVRLVSPEETVFEGEAESLVAPAWDGKVGILRGHAPMIALLGAGELTLKLRGGDQRVFYVAQGVLKVEDDRVTVLAEYAGPGVPEGFLPSPAWPDPGDPLGGLTEPGNPLV